MTEVLDFIAKGRDDASSSLNRIRGNVIALTKSMEGLQQVSAKQGQALGKELIALTNYVKTLPQQTKQVEDHTRKWRDMFGQLQAASGTINKEMVPALGALGLGGITAGLSVAGLVSKVKELGDSGASLLNFSRQTGFAREAVEQWTGTAELFGSSTEEMTTALSYFSRQMQMLKTMPGGGDFFQKLMLSDRSGRGRELALELQSIMRGVGTDAEKLNKTLPLTIDYLRKTYNAMGEPYARTFAQQLGLESFSGTLRFTQQQTDAFFADLRKLRGEPLPTADIDAYRLSTTRLNAALEGLSKAVMGPLLPGLSNVNDAIATFIGENKQEIGHAISSFVTELAADLRALQPLLGVAHEIAGVLNAIVSAGNKAGQLLSGGKGPGQTGSGWQTALARQGVVPMTGDMVLGMQSYRGGYPSTGIPIPHGQSGGRVERTGMAVIHKGETLIPAQGPFGHQDNQQKQEENTRTVAGNTEQMRKLIDILQKVLDRSGVAAMGGFGGEGTGAYGRGEGPMFRPGGGGRAPRGTPTSKSPTTGTHAAGGRVRAYVPPDLAKPAGAPAQPPAGVPTQPPASSIPPPDLMPGGRTLARGGVVRARPGGTIVRLGESGQDEMVIPRSMLPHFAAGASPQPPGTIAVIGENGEDEYVVPVGTPSVKYSQSDKSTWGPNRYNNPGSQAFNVPAGQYFGATINERIGKVDTDYITHFPTPVLGVASNMHTLARVYTGKTIQQIQDVWAPHNPRTLAGLPADEVLTPERAADEDYMLKLMKATAKAEGFSNPMTDADWHSAFMRYRAAQDRAAAGSAPPNPKGAEGFVGGAAYQAPEQIPGAPAGPQPLGPGAQAAATTTNPTGTWPIYPGVKGNPPTGPGYTAQQQRDRPRYYSGDITIENQPGSYPFGTGGSGSEPRSVGASAPYGDYNVNVGPVAGLRGGSPTGGVGSEGVKWAYPAWAGYADKPEGNYVWDTKYNAWRSGVEIHAAGGGAPTQITTTPSSYENMRTNGCFGIAKENFEDFKAHADAEIAANGPLFLHTRPLFDENGNIIPGKGQAFLTHQKELVSGKQPEIWTPPATPPPGPQAPITGESSLGTMLPSALQTPYQRGGRIDLSAPTVPGQPVPSKSIPPPPAAAPPAPEPQAPTQEVSKPPPTNTRTPAEAVAAAAGAVKEGIPEHEAGSWNTAAGLAQLHKGEMVLPRTWADAIRKDPDWLLNATTKSERLRSLAAHNESLLRPGIRTPSLVARALRQYERSSSDQDIMGPPLKAGTPEGQVLGPGGKSLFGIPEIDYLKEVNKGMEEKLNKPGGAQGPGERYKFPPESMPAAGRLGGMAAQTRQRIEGSADLNVNVNAPRGTKVRASAEGLFKQVQLNRQLTMPQANEQNARGR